MGQARLRGTKQQRVAEGVAKAQARERAWEEAKAERWRKLTPAQRARELRTAALIASLMSLGR